MFDEPEEQRSERASDPATVAKEKATEFAMQAELISVFEGVRKFDAELKTDLTAEIGREIQKNIAQLEKARSPEHPVLLEESMTDGKALLANPHHLSTNDYHLYRRPGEVMMVRFLVGEEVKSFYKRLQAHFDVNVEGFKEDERQANEWRQDEKIDAYLKAIEDIQLNMPQRYLREFIKENRLFVLSTQTADEINIAYLSDQIMGISAKELVGSASAPPDEPSDADLAWFFKLFSLRGMVENVESMCFFAYLQKSEESW